ncbi:DUF2530 domain-containing protein [Streptomyces sp. SID10853]|uniref:DUF2530 domain-containing protein n=1 Tax=Streptomyces sp. SID10853 TaxID=2706028 RepID=UPI0013C0FA8C|nr:DUF2530 domain-containing protein [Streptomyces sp. SID10853]NDZ82528.1 DUF2530 domain-containing protein [Streptomyces sp. SID10853]
MAKWTPVHEAPEPLEGPVVATITGGTIIWFVLFVVQLPFYGWFDDHGHLWWLWTCAAGGALGLVGVWYVRGRDAALKRAAAQADTEQTDAEQTDAAGANTEQTDTGPDSGT